MRTYIIGSIVIWCALFLAWYAFTGYAHWVDTNEMLSPAANATILSAPQCSAQVEVLFSMADKFLQAGGPEVPTDLRRNIEACMSSDPVTRDKITATQLIRLFP